MENREREIDIEELKKRVTPMPMTDEFYTNDGARQTIEKNFREIMLALKLDLNDDSLEKTPYRVAKMFVDELFYGLDWQNFPRVTVVRNKFGYNQALTIPNIKFHSCCEHHFVPIVGVAHVSYLPQNWVEGLSKFNRIVDFFARRPQIQERATQQILQTIQYAVDTENVAVTIDAYHLCVKIRGVKDANSVTRTTALGGSYLEKPELRAEYFSAIPRPDEIKI